MHKYTMAAIIFLVFAGQAAAQSSGTASTTGNQCTAAQKKMPGHCFYCNCGVDNKNNYQVDPTVLNTILTQEAVEQQMMKDGKITQSQYFQLYNQQQKVLSEAMQGSMTTAQLNTQLGLIQQQIDGFNK